MHAFRDDNTENYSQAQLAELNRAFELTAVTYLADSVYDHDGELDFNAWAFDDSDGYRAVVRSTKDHYDATHLTR